MDFTELTDAELGVYLDNSVGEVYAAALAENNRRAVAKLLREE